MANNRMWLYNPKNKVRVLLASSMCHGWHTWMPDTQERLDRAFDLDTDDSIYTSDGNTDWVIKYESCEANPSLEIHRHESLSLEEAVNERNLNGPPTT